MCSRFENKETGLSIFEKLNKNHTGKFILDESLPELKSINIAPTDNILILKKNEEKIKITSAVWGIKFQSKKNKPLIFNSRIETVKEKEHWQVLFKNHRCLIPATGFYEWIFNINKKSPYKIRLTKTNLFFIAGLGIELNNIFCVSLITTEANSFMVNIHHRMPSVLFANDVVNFLDSDYENAINMISPLNDNVEMEISPAFDLMKKKKD